MYLHLGQETVVKTDDIIGIFDLDNTTISKKTRDFLKNAEKKGNLINITYDLPKSFIIINNKKGENKVYLSSLLSQTILKRKNKNEII